MRIIHWLFLVSVGLFVAGIGLVVVGARTIQRAGQSEAPTTTPVATIKQVMQGIVAPAATVVFESVGTTVSAAGVDEQAPETDEEWEAVGANAAALAEAGNLLMTGSRALDTGEWMTMSQALADAGLVALKATEAKNADDLLASGEAVNTSCDDCHRRYRRE
jgi:hypothetical protein